MTVELQVTSNYSFLRGGSHPEELFAQAAALGLKALAITDHATLAGIPSAHRAAAETGVRLIPGCRLDLTDGTALLVYPTDRPAWSRLCRLLTHGRRDRDRGCVLSWEEVAAGGEGLLAVLLAETANAELQTRLTRLRRDFGDRGYLALTPRRLPGEAVRLYDLSRAAAAARVRPVASGDVLYHHSSRHILQDVLTCIREGVSIDAAGFRLARHAGRHLMGEEERAHLFARHPEALENAEALAARCRFSLDELRYQYPDESAGRPGTPQDHLQELVTRHLPDRYPDGTPEDVRRQLAHELALIDELAYAPYFLTVHSIVSFARSRGILCQGRGSAANSAVCYVLGITEIDPVRSGLLFERFVSRARHEPPDIDVDFEHDRREEVIQWVYAHYGHDHAALTATVARYHTRGAIREVGKVLGLPEDITAALALQASHWDKAGISDELAAELGLDPTERRLALTLRLANEIIGFPCQLGTHPGGFVLTRDRLDDLVPVIPAAMENRQIIEWDKDDIEALGFMKVDVLGLGMLGCLRRCFEMIARGGGPVLSIAAIPAEDPATYAMIQRADTLGTFQIESRAQMAMLPRLKPKRFYDLVIEVAIVRPGPIQGDMVHPYLRRRNGEEPEAYPSPALKEVLGKTLGVPLFQEQAMRVAIVCAGFTPTEADQLRRSMATFKFRGKVTDFRAKLIAGMRERGYAQDFAEQIFRQIEGFGSYGFPESHAASFALIAYASCWLKCHYPAVFYAALLNSQPMGFYPPAQVVRDARAHGVAVRPISVNASHWECTLEPCAKGNELRLGLSFAKGLGNADAARLIAERGQGPFASAADLARRTGLARDALERLAEADAFADLGQDRRAALWDIRGRGEAPLPLFAAAGEAREPEVALPPLPEGGEIVEDYRAMGLTLRRHPLALLRRDLAAEHVVLCSALASTRDGARAAIAGLVLVRQRPGSAGGVTFVTLEDESGFANVVIWARLFEAQRRVLLGASLLACRGRVQREGSVIHLIAERLEDLSPLLAGLGERGDGVAAPTRPVLPSPRDFR